MSLYIDLRQSYFIGLAHLIGLLIQGLLDVILSKRPKLVPRVKRRGAKSNEGANEVVNFVDKDYP